MKTSLSLFRKVCVPAVASLLSGLFAGITPPVVLLTKREISVSATPFPWREITLSTFPRSGNSTMEGITMNTASKLLLASAFALATAPVLADYPGAKRKVTVEVTNTTNAVYFTPLLVALHNRKTHPF